MSAHEFSSTQFNLPLDLVAHVAKSSSQIPDWALAEEGRESNPHVTVKYGLHTDDPEDVRNIIEQESPFAITLGKTSHFPDSGSGDVVKVDVVSPGLRALNSNISDAAKHTDTHPGYKPHITLAYVKPGMGPHFAKADGHSLEGRSAQVDHVIFSSKNGSKTKIGLKGEKPMRSVGPRYKREHK